MAEFNYKILYNILSNRNLIAKWKKDISNKCPFCGCIQNIKHLLCDWPRILKFLVLISSILKVDITYKHTVIGNIESNEYLEYRKLIINYISYSIYKYWIQSENKKINFNTENILRFIKKSLFSRTLYVSDKLFTKICDKVILFNVNM